MKDALLKSWKTTAIGLLFYAYAVYKLFYIGDDIDFQTIMAILGGTGFVTSKDSSDSHTKR